MDDLISRRAAINAIRNCTEIYLNNLPPTIDKMEVQTEIMLLPPAQPEQRWIPVSERLPEDYVMVLGFTPCDGFMFVGFHVTSVCLEHDFSHWSIITAMRSTKKMTKKVTHWMPLPAPYKKEKTDAE